MGGLRSGGPDPRYVISRIGESSSTELGPPEVIFLSSASSADPIHMHRPGGKIWAYGSARLAQANLPQAAVTVTLTLEDQFDLDRPIERASPSLERLSQQFAGEIPPPPGLEGHPLLQRRQRTGNTPTYRQLLGYLNQLGYPAVPGSTLHLMATCRLEGTADPGFFLPADHVVTGYLTVAALPGAKVADLRDAPRIAHSTPFVRPRSLNFERLEENAVDLVLLRNGNDGGIVCILPRAIDRLSWVSIEAVRREPSAGPDRATPELHDLVDQCRRALGFDRSDDTPSP
ncbi:hypothetical protein [Amorphus sp. 3PC139-8]|uniref:hypothetical protein n=1 Tax=Amorphus sp. 3PC139-8 TaxID=2735676 RepID=UPI00345DFC26